MTKDVNSNFQSTLYYGDNLNILKLLVKEYSQPFLDLVYIDPPFNSKKNYNLLFDDLLKNEGDSNKVTALKEAFSDTWSNVEIAQELEEIRGFSNLALYNFLTCNRAIFTDSQMSYLTMMAHRIYYMHKLLKDSGGFYLHCDDTMSHYLKIILDIIFGLDNYQNQIIWQRTSSHNDPGRFGRISDTLFFYSKSKKSMYFKTIYTPYSQEYLDNFYRYKDEEGKYCMDNLTGPGINNQDQAWRGYHPADRGRSWSVSKEALRKIISEEERKNLTTIEKLDLLYEHGLIEISSKGVPRFKRYLDTMEGVPLQNIWTDIPPISPHAKEKLGYPTQKPEALLERIIESSCPENGIVADFFCGCGTAVAVAERLNRKWLGVDINHLAIGLVEEKRLKPLEAKYRVIGFPQDRAQAEKLAKEQPFLFEQWIVEYVLKGHKTKNTGDGGFDGHISFNFMGAKKFCIIEVKGGKSNSGATIAMLERFTTTMNTQKADLGIFVCFENQITGGMLKHCDQQGVFEIPGVLYQIPKLSILTVEQIIKEEYPQWLGFLIGVTYG